MTLNLRTMTVLTILAALVGGLLAACGIGIGALAGVATPPAATVPPTTVAPQPPQGTPEAPIATPLPLPVATPFPPPPTMQPPLAITPAPVNTSVPTGPALPTTASEAISLLLAGASLDASLQSALPYLGQDLRILVQAGQLDAGSLLFMQNPFSSYVIDQEYGDTQGNTYVDARLFFGGATTGGAGRIFTLSSAEGSWKVVKVTDAAVIPPPPPAWPGPGWTLAAEGDLTGDGVSESVYCAPSDIVPFDSFGDPQLDSISTVCLEVMISSPPVLPEGDHTILLRATQRELVAADGILGSFASAAKPEGAAAHRLAVTPGAKVVVHLLPLAPDGTAHAQGVGVYWNAADGAFRFAGPDVWGAP